MTTLQNMIDAAKIEAEKTGRDERINSDRFSVYACHASSWNRSRRVDVRISVYTSLGKRLNKAEQACFLNSDVSLA